MRRTLAGWLIGLIRLWTGLVLNRGLRPATPSIKADDRLSIGVLDIAGFEIFGVYRGTVRYLPS
jgi:hypothetical protein